MKHKRKLKQKKYQPSSIRRSTLEKILQTCLSKDDLDMRTLLVVYKDILKEEGHVTEQEAEWILANLEIEPASITQK